MATTTANFGFSLPAVNSSTDQDLWGGELNTNIDSIDDILLTCLNWTVSAQTTTITVTAPTAGSETTGSARVLYTCDGTVAAFAANLPTAASSTNEVVAFKKTDSTAHAITITPNGADKIDGAATLALSSQYQYAIIVSDGTNWQIISTNTGAAAGVTSVTYTGDGTVHSSTPSGAVTSTGTLTASLKNQSANLVLSGPASGGSVAPTFRSLVTADMPAGYAPLMTPLAVGSIILAIPSVNLAAGATTAAANLTIVYGYMRGASSGATATGDAISGTWKALQTITNSGFDMGLFQRTV